MSRLAPFAVAGCAAFLSCALACAIGSAAALPLSVLSLLVFLLLLLTKTFPNRRSWLFLFLAAFVSLARFSYFSHVITGPISQYAGSTSMVEGQITAVLPQSGGVRYTLALQTQLPSGRTRTFRAHLWASSDLAAGELGETLSGTVSFYPQQETLWQQSSLYGGGIHLRGKLLSGTFSPGQKLLLETRSAQLRQSLSRAVSNALPGQRGALLSAILLGDRSRLNRETEQALRRAGLSHILALSGLHLSIVAGLFSSLPFVSKRKKFRAFLGIAGMAAYLFLAGAPVSMLRAGGMWLLVFLSQLIDRPYHSGNALGMSVFALVLANPFSAASLSMWYSACSTMAIIWIAPKLMEFANRFIPRRSPRKKLLSFLLTPLFASVSAMAAVIPISWAAGYTISLVSPLSSIAASLLLPPMLILGAAACLLAELIPIPGLSRVFFFLPGIFSGLLKGISGLISKIPFAVVPKGMTWILPCLAGTFVIGAVCLRDGGKKTLLSGLFWCVILFSVSSASYGLCTRDLTRIVIPPGTDCALISRNRTHILVGEIGSLREGEEVADLLEDYQIRRLDLAILNNRVGGEMEPLARQAEILLLAAPPQPSSGDFLRYASSYLPLGDMSFSSGDVISIQALPAAGGYALSIEADGIKLLKFFGSCDIMELDVYPRHQLVFLPAVRAEGIDSLPSDYNIATERTDPYNVYHAPRAARMVFAGEKEIIFTVKNGAVKLQKQF